MRGAGLTQALVQALALAFTVGLPGGLAAQSTTAQVTVQGGVYDASPEALYRLQADGLVHWQRAGVQVGATLGSLGDDDSLQDFRLILFQDLGRRWRYGTELQYSTDAALGGADYALGFRLGYGDAGGTVDTRFALIQNGPDGAFSVTVAMAQDLPGSARVTGLLHRYSTNTELNDFFAIGLGGEADLTPGLRGYGQAIWALADDYSEETTSATLGLSRALAPGLRGFAGLTARDSTDLGTSYGLTAGVTLALSGTAPLFETDPFGQQLAHLGH